MRNDIHVLRHLLHSAKTIAVVGLSAQWNRPSFFAAKYMQAHGYKIIPVNPRYAGDDQTPPEKIMGEICYASLLDIPHAIDIVDVFRRTEDVLPIAHEALQMGATCLWQQLGVENLEADALFRHANRPSVTNRCVKIEHARIFGGLHWAGVNTGLISAKRLQ
jgi:predicted CoA-binding protein